MKCKIVLGLAASLLLAAINVSASNLLLNPGFETPATGVSPGTPVVLNGLDNSGGGSAAADWTVWSNGSANITTELVPSTLPGGGSYMIEVTTTGNDGGLVQDFSSTASAAMASAWVWITSGCVGIGSGADGSTGIDASSCTTGQWIDLSAPNDTSPVTQFILYDTQASSGAMFFVDNAAVAPTPEPAALVLMGSGLLGLAVIVRRRRKTAA